MTDNTYKYCYCRITSKTQDSSGNITNLYYEVIQTQENDPGTEYYEYSKNIYKADSAIDYTDVTVTNGMDPDELYDIIP